MLVIYRYITEVNLYRLKNRFAHILRVSVYHTNSQYKYKTFYGASDDILSDSLKIFFIKKVAIVFVNKNFNTGTIKSHQNLFFFAIERIFKQH